MAPLPLAAALKLLLAQLTMCGVAVPPDTTSLTCTDGVVFDDKTGGVFGSSGECDIAALRALPNLELLELNQLAVTDLAPVGQLTALSELHILNCWKLHDIAPLAKLTRLDHLYLDCNPIDSAAPIAGLSRLTALSIDGAF